MVFWKDKQETKATPFDVFGTLWTIPKMEDPKPMITGFASVKQWVQNTARRNK